MKNLFLLSVTAAAFFFFSCNNASNDALVPQNLTSEEASQIKALGFSASGVTREDGGYIVEGDIFLSPQDLLSKNASTSTFLRVGNEEQYRTTNLITGLPRTITVSISGLPLTYTTALDTAIARYNAVGLSLRLQRITSGTGNIAFLAAPKRASYLASGGFPTGGNPYNQVLVNASQIGSTASVTFYQFCGSILAHEMGHCIGFRHTDYYDRSISCGGATSNEGASTVGAILIPGTPSTASNAANSFMLACVSLDQNRPFNPDDLIALNYLYH